MNNLATDLRDAVVRLSRQLRRQGERHELPAGALSALGSLARHGSMTVGELARHEQVTQPMITRITRRLEDDGLVDRIEGTEDRRVTRLSLTKAGEQLVERRRAAASGWLAERIERLPAADQRALRDIVPVLERLIALP